MTLLFRLNSTVSPQRDMHLLNFDVYLDVWNIYFVVFCDVIWTRFADNSAGSQELKNGIKKFPFLKFSYG